MINDILEERAQMIQNFIEIVGNAQGPADRLKQEDCSMSDRPKRVLMQLLKLVYKTLLSMTVTFFL